MRVQILGTGCAKCKALALNAERALAELGINAEIEKIERIADIARFGVMMTPGLAIDGQVKTSGRVLSVAEVKAILAANAPVQAARD